MKPEDPCPETPEPSGPFPHEKIPPDLLAWARQTFDMEDFMEQVREIEETGGVQFEEIIAEIKARARSR